MSQPREENLQKALTQAAMAAARMEIMAQKARAQKRPAEAALFAALAASASVQAHRFTMLLRGKVHDTGDNLAEAADELLPGLAREYAALVALADKAGNSMAASALDQTTQAVTRQAELAQAARRDGDGDEAYMLCPVCGWLARGEAPDNCPVCGCIAAKFQLLGLPD
ncbi:MAG: hypothetical protein K9K66_00435 [Desulfarculaceae bacterium]|nr:hypothetical protein [Desulfarculaceae bacterium]MCF8072178.1 hypothetical protein [Desulfarculaceae bacterium]MCF8100099.1 hypothetical protein [Desulfarculaceae bacterium]MCF8117926.1 hypothetical protein [Desulfarculaceae bacterium]